MDTAARRRLVHLLLSKSIAEALLVGAVTVALFFAMLSPSLRGVLDDANNQSITGWAVDEAQPFARIEVQLFIDDQFVSATQANQYRPDVHAAMRAQDDWHGFIFTTPRLPVGEHVAEVYAVHSTYAGHRTLQLVGRPFRFRIN